MELDSELETQPQTAPAQQSAKLSIAAALGLLQLVWAASVYVTFGISSYPRQEWLIETLAGGIFLIPALRLLLKHGLGPSAAAVRLVGLALLAHSVWDALHWPGAAFIATPIDSWIPEVCPLLNIPLGAYLLARGK